MKNKRLICVILAVVVIMSGILSISFTAFANTISYQYEAETAVLTIKGSGDMDDYIESELSSKRPWNKYKDETRHIVISNGVSSVGNYSFARFKYVESVELPSSVKRIGTAAFAGISNLTELNVPDSVESVGDYAFGYNENMRLTKGFVAYCSSQSAAQKYCFKNQVPFDTPLQDMHATASIYNKTNEVQLWSFVSPTDGELQFYSTGEKNNVGFLFDSENYVYGEKIEELIPSALAYGDNFSNGDFNFKITYNIEAGKRYYLGTKLRTSESSSDESRYRYVKYDVYAKFTCTNHIYEITSTIEPTCAESGYNVYSCIGCENSYKESIDPLGHDFAPCHIENHDIVLECSRCDATEKEPFMNYYNEPATDENRKFDVNSDGIINAKDYAILYKKDLCKSEK